MDTDKNGWDEWKNHVLIELRENKEDHSNMMLSITLISNQISALQVKSGVWGLVGGLIPVAILVVFILFRGV